MKRMIYRHKNCGCFIVPDVENTFTGLYRGYCLKCNKGKLTMDDIDNSEEDITLYTINKNGQYLLLDNDDESYIITFESKDQANEFADKHGLYDYEILPNVAIYDASVTNGRMIIEKE